MRGRLIAVFALILITPQLVGASSVIRTGEDISVAFDQSVAEDFYALGSAVAISGKVDKDVLLMAETVTINGEVGEDLHALAGTVDVHGEVVGDLRLVAGTVVIAGKVNGNVAVLANELKILSTAEVSGEVMFFGASAVISGSVGKDIIGQTDTIRIDSTVLGEVKVKTRELSLGDKANIAGNLSYTSPNEVVRSSNAIVGGSLSRSQDTLVMENPVRLAAIPFLITLFGALVWLLLFKSFITKISLDSKNHGLRRIFIGFGFIFLVPITAVIMLFSTLGSMLGLLLLFSYGAFIIFAWLISGILLGSFVSTYLNRNQAPSVFHIVVGVLILHILIYIPIVGPLILLVLMLLTVGLLAEKFFLTLKGW